MVMTDNNMGALNGIRVLDLSRVLAAPLATQILGDLGADILKVERPHDGDDSRIYGPAWLSDADGRTTQESSFYICTNRNKRSITIDFSKPEGREIIRKLAGKADVLVENFVAGTLARAGLDYESLREINPRLIYCSVTGYGQTGRHASRRGYDAVFQAQSGLMSVTGHADGEPGGGPMRTGPSLVDVMTGHNAAIGILAALSYRDRVSGKGQHIDIALLDVGVAMQSHSIQGYLLDGEVPQRRGTVGNGGHPARVFTCADGDIYISAGTTKQHEALCEVLGLPELTKDPRYATSPLRFANRREWDAVVDPVIARCKKRALEASLMEAGVPSSLINNYDELFEDPHVDERGLTVDVENPHKPDETIRVVANPIRMSESATLYGRPPKLGEHTAEILTEVAGLSEDEIDDLRHRGVI